MFRTDDAPVRVTITDELASMLTQARAADPQFVVVLSDSGACLVPPPTDQQVIYLGDLQTGDWAAGTACYATADSDTPWWRFRAELDYTVAGIDCSLTAMNDSDLAATIAAGPLPRGLRQPSEVAPAG